MTFETELRSIIDKTKSKHLEECRNSNKFHLITRHYEFGDRFSYIAADDALCEDLQNSRGVEVLDDDTTTKIVTRVEDLLQLSSEDIIRLKEIEHVEANAYIDIGFRVPKLLKHQASNGLEVYGIDISTLNVEIAKSLGYQAFALDVSKACIPLSRGKYLITCYHVIEHASDPMSALKNIEALMLPGSILHIEVPIEPGIPRIRYGHLSEFRAGDLGLMLESIGFDVAATFISTNERYLAVKR